jgi:hypothetical protein
MQKLFELTSQDWMKGLAISGHYPSTGIFTEAKGINPFLSPFYGQSDMGLLQTSAAAQQVGVVVDTVLGGWFDGAAFKAYFIGDDGHFYDQNTSSDNAPTDLRSGTPIATAGEGVCIYQINGGTRYLYYARESFIGRWDLSGSYPTGWDDTYIGTAGTISTSEMRATKIRNFHPFVGNMYWTNKDRIGALVDLGTGSFGASNVIPSALDLPSNMTAVDIDDDGYYLVVAATENVTSGNTSINTINKIYFWDTNSNSWQREWTIHTPFIAAITSMGGLMYALCADGLYAFSFNTPPQLVIPFSTADSPSATGGEVPTSHLLDEKNGTLYWASADGCVSAYGSPIPGMSPRFFKPFNSIDALTRLVLWSGKLKAYISTANDKYGFVLNSSGGATSLAAKTLYVPLGRKFDIKRIEVMLGEPLVSGDSLDIDVQSDEDTSATDWGAMSFALHGAVRSKMLPGAFKAENLRLILNFNGGNVKIKKIAVYGEPVTI